MSDKLQTLYLSKTQAADKFGTVFHIQQKKIFSNLKSYCQLFMGEKNVVHIKEYLCHSVGIYNESAPNVEELKEKYINNLYSDMKKMIEDRKVKLQEYHKSGFLGKARFKLSKLLSENGDQSDPEYVQKSIDFLSEKSKEDLSAMYSFCIEYFDDENAEQEDCILLPENVDNILSLNKLYIAITDHNILPVGVYKATIKSKSFSFVSDGDVEYMNISFECENKEYPEFPSIIYLKLCEDEYKFVNNWTYHNIFIEKTTAHDCLITTIERKIEDLNKQLKQQKEEKYLAGISKDTEHLMLENKF